jgi:hypothetical protein
MKNYFIRNGIYDAFSCQNDQNQLIQQQMQFKRGCASQEVLAAQLAADPTLVLRMNEIEALLKSEVNTPFSKRENRIPVIVNVLYRTAAENISDAQIQSQIDVLNDDFNATNSDFNSVPALFSGVATNVGISLF